MWELDLLLNCNSGTHAFDQQTTVGKKAETTLQSGVDN